jgi:hypothetical protein
LWREAERVVISDVECGYCKGGIGWISSSSRRRPADLAVPIITPLLLPPLLLPLVELVVVSFPRRFAKAILAAFT